ncbi:protein bax [Larsenimonas salina]|uniref:protein bax n=1 Tax=Larsenimonas salina TaxID=1295565 RepID=UPI0020735D15|nr:protein bax [Larsenimonas salina]MCM5703565.1 protein bax [Larsenimonas salina]
MILLFRTALLAALCLAHALFLSLAHGADTRHGASMPDLREVAPGPERKAAFFELIMPLVNGANARIERERAWLTSLREQKTLSKLERQRLTQLCARYRLECKESIPWAALEQRVDTLPVELVVSQAILESGWGTSRLARRGNNLFGMRCFGKECGIQQLGSARRFQTFQSVGAAVEAYILNLNTHPAYATLRRLRAQAGADERVPTGAGLIPGLTRYSTRGIGYLHALRQILVDNQRAITQYRQVQSPQMAAN